MRAGKAHRFRAVIGAAAAGGAVGVNMSGRAES